MSATKSPRNGTAAVLTPPPATVPTAPRAIDPDQIGTLSEWGTCLNLPKHCLKREARLGRLVVYKRAGRLWTDGEAILAWLRSGRVRRAPRQSAGTEAELKSR